MKENESLGGTVQRLSKKEEVELLRKIKKGDRESQEKFLKMNQGLVISIAKKYAFSPDILEDLISEGNLGLLEAIRKFDFNKNTRFGTYAYFWVKRYIKRALANETFKVPEKIQKSKTKYKNLVEQFKLRNNRYPENSEIASLLNLDLDTFLKYKPYFEATRIAPDFRDENDEDYNIFDITDFEAGKRKWDRMILDKEIINKLFERVKEKNKRVKIETWLKALKLHYGIDNGNPRSYKEIADELGITRQRVHQIIKNCLKYLNREIKEMRNEGVI
ncbi:MAG: sigma-70 family RNA polymerase sigma factor [Candidatus Omnitrophica bacterium]|nr:sigma-70 family RNA polymerase sigma factor [Candidatus Omnitrophota bacterium]MCM8817225.1 sigma-70 family RNA polymerase sigma factor [Candidatus Omnitrophota bacterium]